ncbi:2-C-methyl-D-erythritol 4-phosphate cytidylyltransferase [Estrella lausannensis]|uniref:2-C-methyl-D-erythritol 4-phosphate cytidylyltransferase n=1 Tax=Estrella lausannensis TaxID=483423 RepID=A0A0H5DSP2_9BACT|nr:2-C-methyl-D-erythritol 4-phosphate cytidylyltransferase [Estrella lausannensis]CRX38814.1 2-C-methyl-D-erythritol 4-phosphate cytidylyltransferase [Estrella lausannensis]
MSEIRISAVLLSGGVGSRFGHAMPKQYLSLANRPIALHSYQLLAKSTLFSQVIVVCDPSYRELFKGSGAPLFALPGNRRQDSLFNALQLIANDTTHILVHDAARPFVSPEMIKKVVEEGVALGAATLAVPVKATIKEADRDGIVTRTPDRSCLHEIQTPQVIRLDLLLEGFAKAKREELTVTDDVSLAELVGHKVKLVEGSFANLKITTQEDLDLAEKLAEKFAVKTANTSDLNSII